MVSSLFFHFSFDIPKGKSKLKERSTKTSRESSLLQTDKDGVKTDDGDLSLQGTVRSFPKNHSRCPKHAINTIFPAETSILVPFINVAFHIPTGHKFSHC